MKKDEKTSDAQTKNESVETKKSPKTPSLAHAIPLRSRTTQRDDGYELCRIDKKTGATVTIKGAGVSALPFEVVSQYPSESKVAIKKYLKTAHGIESTLMLIDPNNGCIARETKNGTPVILYDQDNHDFYYPGDTVRNTISSKYMARILMILRVYAEMLKRTHGGVITPESTGNEILSIQRNALQVTKDSIGVPLPIISQNVRAPQTRSHPYVKKSTIPPSRTQPHISNYNNPRTR